jgi:hypothetical protein
VGLRPAQANASCALRRRGSDRQDDLFRPNVGFHIIVGSTTAAIGAIEAFQFGGVTGTFSSAVCQIIFLSPEDDPGLLAMSPRSREAAFAHSLYI